MADHDEVNQGENERNNAIPVRTLRDYLQPTRASTPSCSVFPNVVGNFEMKPGVIQLLPKFHGLDSENPYLHLKEFDEVCATLQYNNVTDDVVRLKLFPFSLKEKAKSWLHSLRPNTIRTWQEMTREFLKKFFPTHKTNTLRKNIMHFSQKENETFFQCWERFKDLLLACPHHGYDTWRVISFFYDGITSNMRQFVEMMCNGEFMSKSPDDAWDYFDLLAENAQVWETTNTIERAKPGPSSKGGLYHLKEEDDVNSRIAKLTRKVEAIELGKTESKAPTYFENSCGICETNSHLTKDCPTIPAFQEVLHEQANVANAYRRPFSSPYSETYNSNWQNHPNFSWRNGPSINESQGSSSHAPYVPPHKKSLEDTLQAFIQGQTQINQAVMQDIQELKNSVGRIDSKLNVREKGTFPAQPQPNPKTQFVVNEVQNPHIEHVKAITTLRSGKVIEKDIPKKVLPSKENQETKDDDGPNDKENKEDEQVKVNIPLLDAIQQIPSYAKYLKDLCTVKRKHHVQKKAFLTEQVSAILQCNTPVKYKDPGCPTISCIIGNFNIDRALLDLGASVNLLPYSVYEQLGLGELKPTKVVLQLADRSIRKPRGIVEDVLVKIHKFYFLVDFIVLDTQPISHAGTSIPVILGRPFLATSNALINCRSGVLKLSFGNMTVELNIFNTCNQLKDEEDMHDVDLIETLDSYDKNSEISCTNSLFEFAQEMKLSNGKVQKKELSNHEIELLETSDEDDILELEPPTVEFNSIDIEPKETFPEVTPSKLDSLQASKRFHVLRKHKSAINKLSRAIKRFNSKSDKARSKRKLQLKQWKENWQDSYEDSKIYRQRMLFHDSKFHLLPKKLRSRGIGHFIVKTIYPRGEIGIKNQKNGGPFKVNWKYLKPFLENFISEVESTSLKDPI
uniref:Retrotransposon gag domain-containing protein n=1 Tax=Fagus sylvatica TaxID=28930 RepID=A0A2N9HXP6_FAGSY